MSYIVGIDLGTSNSCCYIMEKNDAKCVTNPNGNRTTPSIVAFCKDDILVGDVAKRQAITNSENTIFGIKRLIGRKFDSKEVQEWIKLAPYKIIKLPNGDAGVEINGKQKTTAEISSHVLSQIKKDVEAYVGETVNECVITVPAYFSQDQRACTKDAGRIAGFDVKRIINEPTSAALAYSMDKKNGEKIAVVDFGGGTLDVSILEVGDGIVEVLSTSGDTFLGGNSIDNLIVQYLIEQFKGETGIDISNDKMALQRLNDAAEQAKKELSSSQESIINLPFITADASGPKHLNTTLTRSKFEIMIAPIVDKIFIPTRQALDDSKLSISDINEVILVGGSTRIPLVQEKIKKFFGKELNKSVNPDEVVAMGASVQGSILCGDVNDILLLDVTPLTLSIETMGGIATKIVDRNTTIPCKKSQIFTTASDNQPSVTIRLCQGEREFFKDNILLGSFDLVGIPPAPKGMPQIEVSINIDANGIINLSAMEKSSGKEQSIVIQNKSGLSEDEIQKLIKESELHKEEDKKKRELIELKNQADSIIYQIENSLKENIDKLPDSEKNELLSKKDELKSYIVSNDIDKTDLQNKIDDLQQKIYSITEKLYQNVNTEEKQQNKKDDEVIDAEFTEK